MKQTKTEIVSVKSALEAARQQIEALEYKLARKNQANRALHEAQRFSESVIELASEGVCVCHPTETYPFVLFTVWNHRMFEITGYTIEQINSLGWCQVMFPAPELQERACRRMERMLQGDNLRLEHWEITRADGEKRLIAVSTATLTTLDGLLQVLGVMRDLTEEERLRNEAMQARIDCLTGVKSRRAFFENARLLLNLAAREKKPVKFAYLDVDNLKKINDTFGHTEGDLALKEVGSLLLNSVRDSDVVGFRW